MITFYRCISDSNNFQPRGNYHELFESSELCSGLKALDQNKPAITCSRADHVGFQTDSVTSNSDSVSKILNWDKVVNKAREKSQSRKFIKYEYRMDYLLKVKPSGIRARVITYS